MVLHLPVKKAQSNTSKSDFPSMTHAQNRAPIQKAAMAKQSTCQDLAIKPSAGGFPSLVKQTAFPPNLPKDKDKA